MKRLLNLIENFEIVPRTKFQLEKFVVNQHDTPQMQFRQIILEASSIYHSLQIEEIERQQLIIKINKLNSIKEDPTAFLEKQKQELGLKILEKNIKLRKKELDNLNELLKKYPDYTPEDIEKNQTEYWDKRIDRQSALEQMQSFTGISSGNLQSLLDIGKINPDLVNSFENFKQIPQMPPPLD